MNADLLDRLGALLGPQGLLAGADVSSRSAGWGRSDGLACPALARPADTAQVAEVLRLCHAAGQPVVTLGGLTGLVHGADTDARVLGLSLERMRAIEHIDPEGRTATAQAGATLQALQDALEAHALVFPLDLGSRGSATLGGIASTNAGGNRVLRYGMMRERVLGLEAVLADGTVVSSLNRVIKNNAGYDLKQLFIGAEGTLGVVTRLVLRLAEAPLSRDAALLAVPAVESLGALLRHMDRQLGGALSAFEVMWPEFYELVTTPPAQGRAPLPPGAACWVLVEAQGADPDADARRFGAALEGAHDAGLIADAAVARSEAERKALWALRDDVSQLFRHGPMFAFDISLPLAHMAGYLAEVRGALARDFPGSRCIVFGHLGDGNLHIVACVGSGDAAARERVERLVYGPLQGLAGSISAEHGIGLEKRRWLGVCRSEAEIGLMRLLKRSLDPKGILNPGRIVE